MIHSETKPAIMMEIIKAVRNRLKEIDISSMAKTIPPRGVLKAEASPAAAPATIQAEASAWVWNRRKSRPTAWKIPVLIWMVGPSRPVTAPPKLVKSELAILTQTTFRESRRSTQALWRL